MDPIRSKISKIMSKYMLHHKLITLFHITNSENITIFLYMQEVRHGVEVPEVVKERNEMRRRNVEDVRSTHFRLGNDPSR